MRNAKRLRLIERTGIPRDEWIALARQWISKADHRDIFVLTCLDEESYEMVGVLYNKCSKTIGTIRNETLNELLKRSGTSL